MQSYLRMKGRGRRIVIKTKLALKIHFENVGCLMLAYRPAIHSKVHLRISKRAQCPVILDGIEFWAKTFRATGTNTWHRDGRFGELSDWECMGMGHQRKINYPRFTFPHSLWENQSVFGMAADRKHKSSARSLLAPMQKAQCLEMDTKKKNYPGLSFPHSEKKGYFGLKSLPTTNLEVPFSLFF